MMEYLKNFLIVSAVIIVLMAAYILGYMDASEWYENLYETEEVTLAKS